MGAQGLAFHSSSPGDVYCKDCKHLNYNGMSAMPYICYGVKVKTFLEKVLGNPQEINKNNNCKAFEKS